MNFVFRTICFISLPNSNFELDLEYKFSIISTSLVQKSFQAINWNMEGEKRHFKNKRIIEPSLKSLYLWKCSIESSTRDPFPYHSELKPVQIWWIYMKNPIFFHARHSVGFDWLILFSIINHNSKRLPRANLFLVTLCTWVNCNVVFFAEFYFHREF